MALTAMDQAQIQKAINLAKNLVENIQPVLTELNVWYDTQTIGAKARLVDGDLADKYSGLTKTQLDDGLYAMTATLKGDLANAITQLAQLATRV